ncbi:MAG: hypothetical protein M9941_03650 [Anaerolineae bacterium]|nr:hypothetical protein [Anaerolineae bacterium]MCO5196828.1 hypothetical protein [Anaerolineae bacterium]
MSDQVLITIHSSRIMSDSKVDQILDLLLDALEERRARRTADAATPFSTDSAEKSPRTPPVVEPLPVVAEVEPEQEPVEEQAETDAVSVADFETPEADDSAEIEPASPSQPSIGMDRMLLRMAVGVLALIILFNIPFNRHGTNLARALPDEQSLVIRDGLVLKGSGDEIYVLANNQKRWITTLEAFQHYGYRWEQVNEVNDTFLDKFEDGLPIHLLYKCFGSPHVYALENGTKRWIKDIPTFEAQGYLWDDIVGISCDRLSAIPDGVPIPPDAGPPPHPEDD